jgi:hypothetical protein
MDIALKGLIIFSTAVLGGLVGGAKGINVIDKDLKEKKEIGFLRFVFALLFGVIGMSAGALIGGSVGVAGVVAFEFYNRYG